MILTLACLVAFAAGYLVRRWHRPVGFVPAYDPTLQQGEWRLLVAGGTPYRSVSARGRFPVAPLGLAELLRAMDKAPAPLSDPL